MAGNLSLGINQVNNKIRTGWRLLNKKIMIESKQRKNGQYYFVVKWHNGQIIVQSEDYASEAARDNGIESLKSVMQGIIFSELKM